MKKITESILGHSVEDRAIDVVLFNVNDVPCPIDVLFIGATHGDEGLSTEVLNAFLAELAALAPHPPTAKLIVIPAINPDGLAKKTRKNANHVDLNRNFPTQTWAQGPEEEKEPQHDYYGGSSPGSEPETKVLMALLEKHPPKVIVSVHTPYRVVNLDGPSQAARTYGEILSEHTGYPVTEDIGYPTPGSLGTYAGVERNIPVLTLELPEDDYAKPEIDTKQTILSTNSAGFKALLNAVA